MPQTICRPKDNAHPMTAECQAIKKWEHGNGPVRGLLSMRLADKTLLCICHHETAKVRWDVLIKQFGHLGNPNINTPKGVAPMELDSTPGEDANPDMDTHAHLDSVGPELSMDRKEDHSLEVEEEGITRENASVEQDIGPCVKLQDPGVSPLAMQEEVRSLTLPSSPPPITPEAASTQRSPVTGHQHRGISHPRTRLRWQRLLDSRRGHSSHVPRLHGAGPSDG